MTAFRLKRPDGMDRQLVEAEGAEEIEIYQSGVEWGGPSLRRVACGEFGLFYLASPFRKLARDTGAQLSRCPAQRVQGLARSRSSLLPPASARGGL